MTQEMIDKISSCIVLHMRFCNVHGMDSRFNNELKGMLLLLKEMNIGYEALYNDTKTEYIGIVLEEMVYYTNGLVTAKEATQ